MKPSGEDLTYGPSRNNFFACYFLFTAVHVLHLIAGMIALMWFMIKHKPVLRYSEEPDLFREKNPALRSTSETRRLGSIPSTVQNLLAFRQRRRCHRVRDVILRLMSEPIVSISNLTFAYGQRTALNDLSLSVNRV